MFQETSLMKKNANKSLIDSDFAIKMRDIAKPFVLLLSQTNIKYKIIKENKLTKLDNHPTIYVLNHYSAQDTPIACNIIDERGYILAGKQRLGLLDNLFFWAYGSIFVDRKDKKDMALSKDAMEQYLRKNKPIIMFPEGTWNLDDCLLILNMKWGIIDVACNTNAQIILINLDYDRDKMNCYVKFERPLLIEQDQNKAEALANLRDIMATLRWEKIEKKPVCKRNGFDIDYERKQNKKSIEEFPKIDINYESSIIYRPNPSNDEVFAPIKKLMISKKNAFLFYKNNKGIL